MTVLHAGRSRGTLKMLLSGISIFIYGTTKMIAEKKISQPKKGQKPKRSPVDTLPELLVTAPASYDDFNVTCETDPENGKRSLHAITEKN